MRVQPELLVLQREHGWAKVRESCVSGMSGRVRHEWERRSPADEILAPAVRITTAGVSGARSSAGEHPVYTRAVGGSKPSAPTRDRFDGIDHTDRVELRPRSVQRFSEFGNVRGQNSESLALVQGNERG